MKISDLLSKEIDPASISSPHLQNEIATFLDLARVGLGLESGLTAQDDVLLHPVKSFVNKILFVDLPAANAFAFRTENAATIAITAGVPLITRALFIGALAEPEVLRDIRDVHYLRTPYRPTTQCDWATLTDLLSSFSFEKFYAWAQSAPRLPQTGDHSGRGDLAIILSMQAWSFIVFHELGHHAMQHLGDGRNRSAGLVYAEVDEQVPETKFLTAPNERVFQSAAGMQLSENLLFAHANELEADRYAVAKMYGGFFRSHPAITLKSANFKTMTTVSEQSRARLFLLTTGIVFLLFEVAGRNRTGNTHPRPLFRLQHLLEFTRTQAAVDIPNASSREFDRGFAQAKHDLMHVARRLGIDNPYSPQPDDSIYRDRMAEIRSSRSRVFTDGA